MVVSVFFPLLQKSHQKVLRRKFRVGLRIIHSSNKQKDKAQQKLNIGHFFRLDRGKKMIDRHDSHLIHWIQFIENHPVKTRN